MVVYFSVLVKSSRRQSNSLIYITKLVFDIPSAQRVCLTLIFPTLQESGSSNLVMADQFKFFVVDLYTDAGIEVAITSERWAIDKDETYYPSHIKGPKWEKMIRSHEAPTKTWATYPYKLRKICGT